MCLLQHWTYTVRRRVQQACLIGDIPQAPNHSHANSVLIIRFLVGLHHRLVSFGSSRPPGLWKRQWIGSSVRKAPKLEPHMDKSLWSLDSKILKKKSLFRHSQSYKWLTGHSDSQTHLIFQRGRMLLVWYLVESPKLGRWSDNPKLPVASKSLPSVWHKTRGNQGISDEFARRSNSSANRIFKRMHTHYTLQSLQCLIPAVSCHQFM